MLAIAAVIGRDFDLEILRRVADLSRGRARGRPGGGAAGGRAARAGPAGAIRYRFTHAFFRQTLYEELIAPRRLRLHQQVARALEAQYASRLEEHAAELAEHFSHSTDPADLAKAVITVSWRPSGRWASTPTGRRPTPGAGHPGAGRAGLRHREKRCDLLLALGEAMLPSEEPRRAATEATPEAFALAEASGRLIAGGARRRYRPRGARAILWRRRPAGLAVP